MGGNSYGHILQHSATKCEARGQANRPGAGLQDAEQESAGTDREIGFVLRLAAGNKGAGSNVLALNFKCEIGLEGTL